MRNTMRSKSGQERREKTRGWAGGLLVLGAVLGTVLALPTVAAPTASTAARLAPPRRKASP